ncbi:MAG: hypothetical protein K9G42_03295 [Pedobacter sp.]|nr:hypothetical protein [Pedobacter sp.]
MKTYILFFIVFLLSFSAYSQTGGGMRRGGHSGSGRATGTQAVGSEGQRTGQRPAEGVKGKERRQGGDCNTGGRGTGIDAGGATGVRTRTGIGTRTGAGTKISQPNIRTNVRVNTGVRSF